MPDELGLPPEPEIEYDVPFFEPHSSQLYALGLVEAYLKGEGSQYIHTLSKLIPAMHVVLGFCGVITQVIKIVSDTGGPNFREQVEDMKNDAELLSENAQRIREKALVAVSFLEAYEMADPGTTDAFKDVNPVDILVGITFIAALRIQQATEYFGNRFSEEDLISSLRKTIVEVREQEIQDGLIK